MKSSIAAIAAFVASATAYGTECSGDCGQAVVVSYCDADVYMMNTPSGGDPEDAQTLSNGDSYSQTYTSLPDGSGWSIKLSPDSDFSQQMQFEYTWQGGSDPVWYDMSLVDVDGDLPFTWEFESNEASCQPDNSNVFVVSDSVDGMQTQCSVSTTLTLNLCKGSSSSSSSSSSVSSAAASSTSAAISSYSSSAAQTTSSAPASSSAVSSSVASSSAVSTSAASSSAVSTSSPSAYSASASSTPTTLATSTSSRHWGGKTGEKVEAAATTTSAVVTTSDSSLGAVVTETDVEVVTQVATTYVAARDAEATAAPHKRHIHGHPHGARE